MKDDRSLWERKARRFEEIGRGERRARERAERRKSTRMQFGVTCDVARLRWGLKLHYEAGCGTGRDRKRHRLWLVLADGRRGLICGVQYPEARETSKQAGLRNGISIVELSFCVLLS